MKPEPLKGKIITINLDPDGTFHDFQEDKFIGCQKEDIHSAVEWLISKDKVKLINEYLLFEKKDFDEAFEDVME